MSTSFGPILKSSANSLLCGICLRFPLGKRGLTAWFVKIFLVFYTLSTLQCSVIAAKGSFSPISSLQQCNLSIVELIQRSDNFSFSSDVIAAVSSQSVVKVQSAFVLLTPTVVAGVKGENEAGCYLNAVALTRRLMRTALHELEPQQLMLVCFLSSEAIVARK